MSLLIIFLFAQALFLFHLSLFQGLCHHHGVAEGVHVGVQSCLAFLDWHYFGHVHFMDYFRLLFLLRLDIAHHFQIGGGHCASKRLFLSDIVLEVLLNFQKFLKLVKLLRIQLCLIETIKLLKLI